MRRAIRRHPFSRYPRILDPGTLLEGEGLAIIQRWSCTMNGTTMSSRTTRRLAITLVAIVGAACGSGTEPSADLSPTTPGAGTGTGTSGTAYGPTAVSLGSAVNYAILAKSGVSSVPTSAITGNIGLSPAAASFITGFSLILPAGGAFSTSSQVTGNVYASDYATPTPATLTTAIADMQTAYTNAAG